jgi:energy-coupling factor transport system ATP-binding protein
METEPIIRAQDVWFSYTPSLFALTGVSLEIRPGETIALIGQNGGGKTTLAKHFNGLLKPTKGRVIVDGVDTKQAPASRLAFIVGYVFQNPANQIFSSNVYDEVAFGPRNAELGENEVKGRVSDALQRVGLLGLEQVHPYDLDYGRMKLLTVASIISMNPKVYCLDEPTTGQDHAGRRKVAGLLKELNREGATVIVITHDMRFVAEVASRTVIINNGRILADGPTREIFDDVDTLTTAKLKPPQVTQLAQSLGARIPRTVLTIREMNQILAERLAG